MALVESGKRGELGKDGIYFSDLYADAVKRKLTVRVRITVDGLEANAFFREGKPSHVSGTALQHDYLGEILVQQGVVKHPDVDKARETQSETANAPLGAILTTNGAATEAQVKGAVRVQIDRRVRRLFTLEKGRYEISTEQFAEIKRVEVEVGGEALLLAALKAEASEAELNDASDALLGNAVKIACPRSVLSPLALDEADNEVINNLNRPRKTHHLEIVASSRRNLRALLKTLLLLGHLEKRPAREGVAIREAVKVPLPGTYPGAQAAEPESPPVEVVETPVEEVTSYSTPPPRSSSRAGAEAPEIKELRALYAKLKKVSHFELLGVKETAPPSEIRVSFTNLAKRLHPDALGGDLTPELAAIAREVASAMNEAHATLTDAERRTRYLAQMREGNVAGDEQTAGRSAGAKVKYEMALVFLKKHDFRKARETLKQAVDMAPKNGLYRGTHAWAIYADPTGDRAEALETGMDQIEEAIRQAPEEAVLHFYHGRMLKERKENDRARSAFEKAVALDPKHRDASAELRLLEMRESKDEKDGKRSALSRLFRRS